MTSATMTKLRMTFTTGVVLQSISRGYRYGFDIMDVSGLPDGTVYPALRRLEDAGMLLSEWESEDTAGKRPQRCYYRLTDDGLEMLASARAKFPALSGAIPQAEVEAG
jgi:DNA-binding PadR family transcriptional regulator